MKKNIKREKEFEGIKKSLSVFPCVAILDPRQVGKTHISREFKFDHYFDLDDPETYDRFKDPKLILNDLDGLIIIDEAQRCPGLFSVLRTLLDYRPKQKYLLLGSASFEFVKITESLAGRIGYHYLDGFNLDEIGPDNWKKLWLVGGMPRAYLAGNNEKSFIWIKDFITSFLIKDIRKLGLKVSAESLRRFWLMLCHYQGGEINYTEIAVAMNVTDKATRYYLDILRNTYMVRVVQPWHVNIGKRQLKRPKVYIRDTGVFHQLIDIKSIDKLMVYPRAGFSFEGFAIEQLCKVINKSQDQVYSWGVHSGPKLDLLWEHATKYWGVEIKLSSSPQVTKSMYEAIKNLNLQHLWVIYPGDDVYKLHEKITVCSIKKLSVIRDALR